MSLSPKDLAKLLNDWHEDGRISVSESRTYLTVRAVDEEDALSLLEDLDSLGWPIEIEDASEAHVSADNIQNGIAPFKFTCTKPAEQLPVQFLTNAGLQTWLTKPDTDALVELGALDQGFATYATSFVPWGHQTVDVSRPPLDANPRRFVREVGERRVPENLSRFVLLEGSKVPPLAGPAKVWAKEASRAMARSLCSEVDGNDVMFRGPPTSLYPLKVDFIEELGEDGFLKLTELARWVFEFSAEAETRHGLVIAELARWPARDQRLANLYKESGTTVLESAKIAHQMGLQKISADSMKTLSDLRKTVADEASKLNDVTRQLAGAVSSSLFGGAAVVIARLSLKDASSGVGWAIIAVAIVLFGYVLGVALSGYQFIRVQRELRAQWREKLYRFLSEKEYKDMVEMPAARSEQVYCQVSVGCVILAIVLSVGIIYMGASLICSPAIVPASKDEITANAPLEVTLNGVSVAICSAIAIATFPVSLGTSILRSHRPSENAR